MIADSRASVAAAVAVALGETAHVYSHLPETASAPCAWVDPVSGGDFGRGWETVFDVTIVADTGLTAADAAAQLDEMTDAVLALDAPGIERRGVTFRGGGLTTRIGDTPHPCTVVSVPQLNQVC